MTKQELRKHIRTLKNKYLTGEPTPCEVRLTEYLPACKVVMLYCALPDEVPTQGVMDELVAQGKTVLLPRVINDTEMELCRYAGNKDLRQGAYGIMEPTGEVFTDYDAIDVAIIPGMAFDEAGHRLGRGKGYYDRFLARVPNLYKIGLCFSWQLVAHIPCDEHDIRMDRIIRI
jgi:5-formyltetrahydrofolate cyclo-ligase